jgi:DME family drug/metabolite transporter
VTTLSSVSWLVYVVALTGAVCSASATIFIRQGLRSGNAYSGFWINLAVGTVGLWAAVFLLVPGETVHPRGLLLFALSGLIGTMMGRLLRFISIDKVGASVAAAVTNLNPFISTALAIAFLGERVTLPILAGTCVIVLGTILLSASGRSVGFRPLALLYPLLCATCFGVVAIIRKVGLSHMSPLLGLAINVSAAFIAFSAFLCATGQARTMVCKGRSLWCFIAAGIAENAGVFLTLVALGLGTVSVVAPLTGTAPLFVLPMTFVFLKGVETLNGRIVLGVILIVLGVYLLTRS